ncbi:hypothetical protein SKAU_G00415850 [Synaphobranchus kaupii]|uniref:Uncharacterized protein n=1 Tax=Synaphobranchus kaupii TaxID=118154 RepID=A0A9Q1E7H7_SYNKA|nr:hypothetical protein SKAU_G00415850 [Synaphobranchus kaupii]
MQILEEHYLESLGHLTKKLENIHLSNWLEAFQVATRKHHTTRETEKAVGSQDTTETGNQNHCRNDP